MIDKDNERGASLVEAALVTPLFVFLLFSIIEMGLLFRDSLTTDNASRAGARAASTQAANPEADYFTLRSVEHGLSAMGLERLQYVVVFNATGPGAVMPAACASGSVVGVCNHYTADAFFAELDDGDGNDTGNFRCGGLDSAWCPTTRPTELYSTTGGVTGGSGSTFGTGFVGVHVETRHDFITGLFGDGNDLGETTVIRLEPTTK